LEKYAEHVSKLFPSLTQLAVDNVVSESQRVVPFEWKKLREKYMKALKGAFSENELVLFLGAGVSLAAGLPDWQSLLSQLMVAMIGEKLPKELGVTNAEKQIIATKLGELHGQSPLLEARYVRDGLGDTFIERLSKSLYEGMGENSRGTSHILDALASLCLPRRKGPGIRAVVSYNFDDLLESHLAKLAVRYRSIYRDNEIASQNELGVYHVHGFLPRSVENYDGLSESLLVPNYII
jgi:hypothetical protein